MVRNLFVIPLTAEQLQDVQRGLLNKSGEVHAKLSDDISTKEAAIVGYRCTFCQNNFMLVVPIPDWDLWDRWRNGEVPIEDALPAFDASMREALNHEICLACLTRAGDA